MHVVHACRRIETRHGSVARVATIGGLALRAALCQGRKAATYVDGGIEGDARYERHRQRKVWREKRL